jgi:hypothetical protein
MNILRDELLHGLWAVLWCSPLLLGLWLTWIIPWRSFWEFLAKDSFTRILLMLALGLWVLGLAWLSHVFADFYQLGF